MAQRGAKGAETETPSRTSQDSSSGAWWAAMPRILEPSPGGPGPALGTLASEEQDSPWREGRRAWPTGQDRTGEGLILTENAICSAAPGSSSGTCPSLSPGVGRGPEVRLRANSGLRLARDQARIQRRCSRRGSRFQGSSQALPFLVSFHPHWPLSGSCLGPATTRLLMQHGEQCSGPPQRLLCPARSEGPSCVQKTLDPQSSRSP